MAATIFLHIGTGKTGTTAIQQFLNQHRDALKKFGLLYPEGACMGVAHYELSRVLGFGPYIGQRATPDERLALAAKLKAEIETSAAPAVFLSSEYFSNPKDDVASVKSFFDRVGYPVKIIVYLRRHDTWWESTYNQAVKTVAAPPWGRNIKAFIRFQQHKRPQRSNYRDLLDRWAAVFGKENIIVRPYEKQQNEPDIVSDSLNALGFGFATDQLNARAERVNESLSFFALSLLDIYQRVAANEKTRARLIQYALSFSETGQKMSIMPPGLRRQLVDENSPDYEYIAREYLGREGGCLFYEPLPALDEAWQAPSSPNVVQAVEATIAALEIS